MRWGDQLTETESDISETTIRDAADRREDSTNAGYGVPTELTLQSQGLTSLGGGGLFLAGSSLTSLSVPFNSLVSLDGIGVRHIPLASDCPVGHLKTRADLLLSLIHI